MTRNLFEGKNVLVVGGNSGMLPKLFPKKELTLL